MSLNGVGATLLSRTALRQWENGGSRYDEANKQRAHECNNGNNISLRACITPIIFRMDVVQKVQVG